jgi:ribonucleoside-triphosphate reductase
MCGRIIPEGRQICPICGKGETKVDNKKLGKGVKFERIRRITGYLVGTLDKWNDAKKAEEKDRVKHGVKKDG